MLKDGKILACGQTEGNGTNDLLLAKFNADGSLDKSFGNGGYVKYHIAGHDYGAIIKVHLGRIYISGSNFIGGSPSDQYILCLNMDGTLDASFGIGGLALIDIDNGSNDSFTDFKFLLDGSLILFILINSHFLLFSLLSQMVPAKINLLSDCFEIL